MLKGIPHPEKKQGEKTKFRKDVLDIDHLLSFHNAT